MTPLIFALAARDEAAVIERCIRAAHAAAPHARFLLWDTGSTDDTVAIAKATAADLGMELLIDQREWMGFGETWSRLLRRARSLVERKGWIWLLDADETIEPPPKPGSTMGAHLTALRRSVGGYTVCRLEGDGDYENPGIRIFNAAMEWEFIGERHAAPRCKRAGVPVESSGLDVRNHRDGARGNAMPEAEQRARFAADFEHFAQQATKTGSTRATYYAAQSASDAGLHDVAQDWYRKRAGMGGNPDEQYLSLLRSGQAAAAWELDPGRLCAPMWLADVALADGNRTEAMVWTERALASAARVGFLTQRSHRWRRYVLAAQVGLLDPARARAEAELAGAPDVAMFALELLGRRAAPLPPDLALVMGAVS